MTIYLNAPTVEEMQRKVTEFKDLKKENDKYNDNIYISKIFKEIPYFADKGADCFYMDEDKLNTFIEQSRLIEGRNYQEVANSIKKKINNNTEYFSYSNINGLAVYWGKNVKERKAESIKNEMERKSKVKDQEEPKLNIFGKFYNFLFERNSH